MKLAKNQKVDVQCIVRKGTGKEHAKWSPVSTVQVQQLPKIRIESELQELLDDEEKIGLIESCPSKVYKLNDEKHTVDIENITECMQCQECTIYMYGLNKKENLLKVDQYDDQFLFTVESTGALPPEEIVSKGFSILIDKMSELSQCVDEAGAGNS